MLVLASGSETRARMLRAAGLAVAVERPRVDEAAATASLLAEGTRPRDLADALAELKALKVSGRRPEALVIGADQVLELDGAALGPPASPEEAIAQVRALAGRTHALHSAAVLARDGRPLWRHVGTARLTLRPLSEPFVADYMARNWDAVRHSIGGYVIEGEGVRLMERIEGDHFTILGLPLLPLLGQLARLGEIAA